MMFFLDMGWDIESGTAGALPQKMHSCLTTMDILLQQAHAVVGSMVLAEKQNYIVSNGDLGLVSSVANVLGIENTKSINKSSNLMELGMDSLMSTEIKHILEKHLNHVVASREIKEMTFDELEKMEKSIG